MNWFPGIPFSRATARDLVLDLLRTTGHAGLAANYHEHWQLSLDLNQAASQRAVHLFYVQRYSLEIARVLECNNWHRLLNAFDPPQR